MSGRAAARGSAGPPLPAGRPVATARLFAKAAPLPIAVIAACTVLTALLPIANSWFLKVILDSVAGAARSGNRAFVAAAGLAGTGVALVVLQQCSAYAANAARRGIRIQANVALYEKVAVPGGIGRFEDPGFQNQLRLAGDAADTAPSQFLRSAVTLGQGCLQIGGWLVVLLAIRPAVVPILVVTLVPVLLAQFSMAHRQSGLAAAQAPRSRRQFAFRMLLADPAVAKEIQLFGMGRFLGRRLIGELRVMSRQEAELDRRATRLQVGLGFLDSVVTVVVVCYAAHLALTGRLSVGDVSLFLGAAVGLQSAATAIITSVGSAYSALLLLGNLHHVLGLPPDLPEGRRTATRLRASIEVRDVWFRYREDLPWVLRGVSFTIPVGTSVGLVGVNGAGKSTLVKLLCRLYDPERGQILWDGVDVRDFSIASYRARLSAVFQDFVAYDLTAAENIAVGDAEAVEDGIGNAGRIERAARLAGIAADLAALPAGYATLLSRIFPPEDGGRSATLSGGQWQRVALARAFLREESDLLILDEPTAVLDAEAEYRIQQRLRALRQGRTSILISHRMSTQREADVVLVLEDGVVVEQGGHADLVAADGLYARLFDVQARGYQDPVESGPASGTTGLSATVRCS